MAELLPPHAGRRIAREAVEELPDLAQREARSFANVMTSSRSSAVSSKTRRPLEWVADESRCCPAVDFHVELPAFGALTLRLDGGAEVKEFIAAELGL